MHVLQYDLGSQVHSATSDSRCDLLGLHCFERAFFLAEAFDRVYRGSLRGDLPVCEDHVVQCSWVLYDARNISSNIGQVSSAQGTEPSSAEK